jgi:predicted Rossmann fold flavoprotein
VRLQAEVQSVVRQGSSFLLRLSEGEEEADRVVVTSGGKAAPHLGGTDSGVMLLKKFGHKAVPLFPALVPVKTEPHFGGRLKGVKVIAGVHLDIAGDPGEEKEGEILFTDYGLSGPPVIELSHKVNRAHQDHQPVSVALDLFPAWSKEELVRNLSERFCSRPEDTLERSLIGLIHKRLIPVVLQQAGIGEPHTRARQVSPEVPLRIAEVLKRWTFEITGSLSWNDAQVMGGGISTRDFSADTLESRLVKGLFAAGELLDVTGDCGGYNLQWAWSSGHVAGLQSATV